jgi:hypothetical protein
MSASVAGAIACFALVFGAAHADQSSNANAATGTDL